MNQPRLFDARTTRRVRDFATWVCVVISLLGCDQRQTDLPAAYPESSIVRPETSPGQATPDTNGQTQDPGLLKTSKPPAPASNQPGKRQSHKMAGMVGQVNGNPLYADAVLKPVKEQLAALGLKLNRSTFRKQARQIVKSQLRQIVVDALILGEAERDLTDRERQGLKSIVQRKREELLRRYGQGSEALAKANIRDRTGKTLTQTLEDHRRKRLVRRHLRRQIRPKIHVTRRDIRRYYREHLDEYQPPVKRKLRLIRLTNESEARRVAQRLKRGERFKNVAAMKANENMPSTGGQMGTLEGKKPLRYQTLNRAIDALDPGEWAGPVEADGDQWFVYLDELDEGESKSLMDVQKKIEEMLRRRRYRLLSGKYRRKLLETGSYNSIQQMTQSVVEIAVNRYAASGRK